jgi:cytochrome c oxidase assembly protein subunit 11
MSEQQSLETKNRRLLLRLLGAVAGMTLFAFALVPLYDVFCDLTGINGKTGGKTEANANMQVDASRSISLDFIAIKSEQMAADFKPKTSQMDINPGQVYETEFYVKNRTDKPVVLQAVPSVAPGQVAVFLHKTECFCFNQQPLQPGEEKWLPLRFFLDTEFPEETQELTLQYTLYDISASVNANKTVADSN